MDQPLATALAATDLQQPLHRLQSVSRFLLGKEDEPAPPSLTFDTEKDPLRLFLQNLTATLSAQARKTAHLESLVQQRSQDGQIGKVIERTVACIPGEALRGAQPRQQEFKKVDCAHTHEPFDRFPSSKGFPELSHQAARLGGELKVMGGAVLKSRDDYEFLLSEVVELKTRADKAADNEQIRAKVKRAKNLLSTKFTALSQQTRTELGGVRRLVGEKLDDLGDQMRQTEQNTLWKITDCQELLRDRVSEQHVRQALKNLEERITLDLETKTRLAEERMEAVLSEFRKKLREQGEASASAIRELREKQAKISIRLENKAETQALDEHRREAERTKEATQRELDDIHASFKRSDREFMEIHKALNGQKHALDNTVRQVNQMMAQQTALLQNIQLQLHDKPEGKKLSAQLAGGEQALGNIVPPEQLLEMQNQLTAAESRAEAMQRDVDKLLKSQTFQDQQIARLETAVSRKADREEMRAAVESRAVFEEMNKQLQREFMKLKEQLDNTLRHFEQKFIKMRPDGELKALQKMLKGKANGEDVGKELQSHDSRIRNHENVLAQINDELEAFAEALHSTQDYIENLETNSAEVLAGTKSINCLSCGRNEWGQLILGSAPPERSASPVGGKRKMAMKRFGVAKTQDLDEGPLRTEEAGPRVDTGGGGGVSMGGGGRSEKKKVKLPLSFQVQHEAKQGFVKN